MAKRALYKETAEDPLGAKLYITSYRVLRHAEQSLAQYDLSFHSYLVLYYVDKIPRISMRELGEYLDVTGSIVSRTIQNLQAKNLVKRATSSDKRKSELALTPEARRKLRKASGTLHEVSFLLRHQPNFRIAEIDAQLDKIQSTVAVAKSRPLLTTESKDQDAGESVLVRIGRKVGM